MVSPVKKVKALVSPRVRLPAADRRLQIVQAAIELFSSKGFEGTTTKEIALASGVNEAIIFRHFATKEELYSAIIDYKMNERRRLIRTALDEAAVTKDDQTFYARLVFEMLESYRRDPHFMRLMLYSGLEGHQLSRMVYETHAVEMLEYLARYIAERTKEGAYRSVSPRVAARAFIGMIVYQGLVRELFDPAGKLLKLDNKQAAAEFSEIFLNGVLRRPECKPANGLKRSARRRRHPPTAHSA